MKKLFLVLLYWIGLTTHHGWRFFPRHYRGHPLQSSPKRKSTNNVVDIITNEGNNNMGQDNPMTPYNEQEQEQERNIALLMNEVESTMLPHFFGHNSFRPGQREVISRILANQSCLAVLPTGAGKSLLYMLPSQLLEGITLVVSPLLALMRDQVEVLQNQGINAARLDSSMSYDEVRQTVSDIRSMKVKVLYVSPERFNNEAFRKVLSTMKVSMFVVDEAHCISEWGHAFRPDYLRLSHFATVSNAQVRLALTATATKRVVSDILEKLEINDKNVVQMPSSRRNLALRVRAFSYPHDGYEDRLRVLLDSLESLTGGGAAIIYVSRQKLAERLAQDLITKGKVNAKAYHAGMETEDREEVEEWFLNKNTVHIKAPVVVGTVAFGMGIDKSDTRSVIHFDLPRSVEEYVQGCGRAGRDNQSANCLAFLSASDIPGLRSQIFGNTPQKDALIRMVQRVFSPSSYLSQQDKGVLYISVYDLSYEMDISELQLRMSLSHLVQTNVISELTHVYGKFKCGVVVNEKAYQKVLSDWAQGVFDHGPSSLLNDMIRATTTNPPTTETMKRLADLLVTILRTEGGGGDTKQASKGRKKKWLTIDTIEFANDHGVKPSDVVYTLSYLVRALVCEDSGEGGLSRIYNRYRILPSSSIPSTSPTSSSKKIKKSKIVNTNSSGKSLTGSSDADVDVEVMDVDIMSVANSLSIHANEIQRRGLARVDEAVSLLYEGTMQQQGVGEETSDMWTLIGAYFGEFSSNNYDHNHDIHPINDDTFISNKPISTNAGTSMTRTSTKGSSPSPLPRDFLVPHFDEGKWAEIVELVEDGILPRDDPRLIARFATGVYSPRISKLKLGKHDSFGTIMHCDWLEILQRAQQMI